MYNYMLYNTCSHGLCIIIYYIAYLIMAYVQQRSSRMMAFESHSHIIIYIIKCIHNYMYHICVI